jgi:exosortase
MSLVVAVLFWRPLLDTALLTLQQDPHHSHIGLIPLIFLYLLWTQKGNLATAPRDGTSRAAIPAIVAILIAGLAFRSFGQVSTGLELTIWMAAFVAAYWAGFIFALGWQAAEKVLFPLAFLLFMIPPPAWLLEAVTDSLLWGTAWVTDWMFSLAGTPVFRQAYTFYLPGVAIEIAEQCSGIRSTLALVITGLIAGYFLLRSPWSRLVLILLLFPLSVFKNGLRIVTLTLLSIHVDPGFLDGDLHHEGGIVFFLITLAIMGLMIKGLRYAENRGRKTGDRGR